MLQIKPRVKSSKFENIGPKSTNWLGEGDGSGQIPEINKIE